MRLVASPRTRARIGMAMIATTNSTSKLIMARPKSLSFRAGTQTAGLYRPTASILPYNEPSG